MNAYAAIVLAALLLEYVVGIVADLLELRALRPEPPPEVADVYDPERYRRSQEYTRARTRFRLVPATFHLLVLLGFWGAGGFAWLDGATRALELGPIPTGLVFVGALALASSLLGLPFAWYATFRIEERFGFNRTSPRTFWLDRAKGLLLAVVLGAPLLALVLWFLGRAGEAAWLWCWLVVAVFSVTVQLVAPTWILPLFHRFRPLEEGELRDAVLAYARRVSFPLEGLFVVDGSRRSTKANAFFTGFGRRKRVALYDTLIAKHTLEELVAIVAHEIGHYKRHHILQSTVLGILQAGAMLFLLSLFLREPALFEAFGVQRPSVHAGLVFFALLFAPVELVLSLLVHAFSRRNEYEADRYARETTGTPAALISGLKKLSADSLTNLTPHPFYVLLHHSHPPLPQRIAALRR